MSVIVAISSVVLIGLILQDGFEALLLPRRVPRQFRFARYFYRFTWKRWKVLARSMGTDKRRATCLSFFGPLSMLILFSTWAFGLITLFALLQWSVGSTMRGADDPIGLFDLTYFSGVTFFTLGYGDITPINFTGRFLAMMEAGIGFAFLAVVISYLPVLYQAFSQREHTISLLDARAGSPPTTAQLLLRLGPTRDFASLTRFLEEWERWSAVLLESHLSFPVLAFYRSQHDNQSWLAALTVILDTCALALTNVKEIETYQVQLTFAMARHAVVDMAQAFATPPHAPRTDRLSSEQLQHLRGLLQKAGFNVEDSESAEEKLKELRGMYEPFVNALGSFLMLNVPPFMPSGTVVDNWQTSAWMRHTQGIGTLVHTNIVDDHED